MGTNKYEVLGLLQLFIKFNHLFIQIYALSSSTLSDSVLDSMKEKDMNCFLKAIYSLGR